MLCMKNSCKSKVFFSISWIKSLWTFPKGQELMSHTNFSLVDFFFMHLSNDKYIYYRMAKKKWCTTSMTIIVCILAWEYVWKFIYIDCMQKKLILIFVRRKIETDFGVLLSLLMFIIYMCTTCNMYLIHVKADKFWRKNVDSCSWKLTSGELRKHPGNIWYSRKIPGFFWCINF